MGVTFRYTVMRLSIFVLCLLLANALGAKGWLGLAIAAVVSVLLSLLLLRKQREHLLRFLDHDGLDATNNLAEREIRPAVIARKLSAGNRTEAGAETHAVLASVLRTCRRQGRDILACLGELLRNGPSHVIAFRHLQPNPTTHGIGG